MTSVDRSIVTSLAIRIGVDSDIVIRKALEISRLLQLRMSASSGIPQLSDPCRILLSLNVACNILDTPFDKTDLIRLAGVNKKQFSNALHLVEKLLGRSSATNVNSLCVQLGISEVSAFAQKILNKYVELHSASENRRRPLDLSLPMYHCAAVLLACKHNKIKVDKSALLDASRIKGTQFNKLLEEFTAAFEKAKLGEVQKVASKRSHKLIEFLEKHEEDSTKDSGTQASCDPSLQDEDFETWKKRILSNASDEL